MSHQGRQVQCRGLRVDLPGRPQPAPPLDLALTASSRVVFLGRSGSGKSLLSRVLLGRLPPSPARVGGSVRVLEQAEGTFPEAVQSETPWIDLGGMSPGSTVPLLAACRSTFFGYVPQGGRENLVPGWTLAQHVDALTDGEAERCERAYAGMATLGLEPDGRLRGAVATELSEGMIRRALLALSVSLPTSVLVVDEPTTGLDPASRRQVVEFLGEALAEGERGLVLTSHDLEVAEALGAEFYRVEDGRLVAKSATLDAPDGPFSDFLSAREKLREGTA